jgi:hypothetical protein
MEPSIEVCPSGSARTQDADHVGTPLSHTQDVVAFIERPARLVEVAPSQRKVLETCLFLVLSTLCQGLLSLWNSGIHTGRTKDGT